MKSSTAALAAILVVGLAAAQASQSLVDVLKHAYSQSLDDVMKELAAKPNADPLAAVASNSPISHVVSLSPVVQPTHKRALKAKTTGFITETMTKSVMGPDGKMHVTQSKHKVLPATGGSEAFERKLPDLLNSQPGSLIGNLLNLPFAKDIEEESPVVVVRKLDDGVNDPLSGLIGSLLGVQPKPATKIVRHKRTIRRRTRRVVKRRTVTRRRRVTPQIIEEPLHPDIAHVANLYGNFLDSEIERHRGSIQPEDATNYHHKVLAPKLISVREVPKPVRSEDPLEAIAKAIADLPDGRTPTPVRADPALKIRIIGPTRVSNVQPAMGGIFGDLLSKLGGTDIDEAAPLRRTVHRRRRRIVRRSATIHKIQHSPALTLPTTVSPLNDLLESIAGDSLPTKREPVVIVRRISTPLLNDNYGKPLLYGASTFPSVGHGTNRRPFSPVDFLHLLGGSSSQVPDPLHRNREPGFITHKRNGRGRPMGMRATLTNADLQQLINGLLPSVTRRKRDLGRFRTA